MSTLRAWGLGAVLLALSITQYGCKSDALPEGQVVARVNDDEISIHQLNFAITNTRNRVAANTRESMLDTMIDRQLAVQQALALGLDRRPDVMMRLEEMRLETLATAYAAEMARQLPEPTDEQVASFYRDHPGLFAERRIYRLREVTVPVGTPLLAELKIRLEKPQPMADTLGWLRQKQVGHTEQSVMRPAEELPLDVIDRLVQLQPGQTVTFETPAALILYEVVSTESAPFSWARATPLIRAHLAQEQARAHLRKTFSSLRQQSRIHRNALPAGPERP
ncbi:EpsD family peptidyl-prolyl cis-trans isomerase [Thauera aromatica]|uniref:EpsD family peptidyl-prolyl cis-trans isomerase n=1 Tax=Thauera aromatica TaxID=59405 RepID=UPI001FFCA083|nr:EpsD family peptidyl-prolyl cis-trans isomerase [Thauera aromatica]MCK2086856.1 EpsD family peptidyl-prolyl cis-trans isomerase [Thauera aromatica]